MTQTSESSLAGNTAFAYLRVSTRKQDSENQRNQITKYAQSHGLTIGDNDWYVDDAVSGTIAPMERKHFRDMMETLEGLASEGKAPKFILVYEISRLGRDVWDILNVIPRIEKLSMLCSTSPREEIFQMQDKSFRNLIILIVSWVADFEKQLLIQRTNEGLAVAQEANRHSGNVPLGYDIHRCQVGICIKDTRDQCPEHGKLRLNDDGKITLEMLEANPNLKPRQLRDLTETENDYQRFALIRNVKKFGNL